MKIMIKTNEYELRDFASQMIPLVRDERVKNELYDLEQPYEGTKTTYPLRGLCVTHGYDSCEVTVDAKLLSDAIQFSVKLYKMAAPVIISLVGLKGLITTTGVGFYSELKDMFRQFSSKHKPTEEMAWTLIDDEALGIKVAVMLKRNGDVCAVESLYSFGETTLDPSSVVQIAERKLEDSEWFAYGHDALKKEFMSVVNVMQAEATGTSKKEVVEETAEVQEPIPEKPAVEKAERADNKVEWRFYDIQHDEGADIFETLVITKDGAVHRNNTFNHTTKTACLISDAKAKKLTRSAVPGSIGTGTRGMNKATKLYDVRMKELLKSLDVEAEEQ